MAVALANAILGKRRDKILSILFLIGYFGTLASVSTLALKLIVSVVAVILFYFFQTRDEKSPFLFNDFFVLSAGFLLLTGIWSFSYFFSPHWWVVMILTFVLFFVFMHRIYSRVAVLGADALLWALIAALLMAEVAWAALHLPVHFLTSAVLNFGVFYLVYQFSSLHFAGKLAKNKVYFHALLIGIVVILSLTSSPWRP